MFDFSSVKEITAVSFFFLPFRVKVKSIKVTCARLTNRLESKTRVSAAGRLFTYVQMCRSSTIDEGKTVSFSFRITSLCWGWFGVLYEKRLETRLIHDFLLEKREG